MSNVPSGYATHDEFYASRYTQGARRVYGIDLTPAEIASYLPKPDPDNPTEGNRRVRRAHAAGFGTYMREHEAWVSPALLLRAPDIFDFDPVEQIGSTEFGKLKIPRMARTDLRILDGQHRILGVHIAIEDIASELERLRDMRAKAKRGGASAEQIGELNERLKALEHQRERLNRERVSIQIMVEDDSTAYKQMFVDIADNALGITSSVRTRFDSRKIVNRCVEPVSKHALLDGRVDNEQDRIGANNPNLLGAKHVADIVRTVTVGLDGRVGRRLEDELREDALVNDTNNFLDVMVESFEPLAAVADGKISPEELRKDSLLGSTSMLRVLAGVYHVLHKKGWDDERIGEYFSLLDPEMFGPLHEDSRWISELGGDIFSVGALAPKARRQDLLYLMRSIVGWAEDPNSWPYKSSSTSTTAA